LALSKLARLSLVAIIAVQPFFDQFLARHSAEFRDEFGQAVCCKFAAARGGT